MSGGRSFRQDLYIKDWPEDAAWQRRASESDPSWLAFMAYLSLSIMERTVRNAYDVSGGTPTPKGEAPSTWYTWSARHHWADRALEYERWRNQQHMIDEAEKADEENRRWADIRQQERERSLNIGRALIQKAEAMLQFPLATVERVTQTYEDGRERQVQIFRPGAWRFGDAARLVDIGMKLVRLSAEMDTERATVDMRVILDEADQLASKHGLNRNDLLAMADLIVSERYGEGGQSAPSSEQD